jgi:hypothetical protein
MCCGGKNPQLPAGPYTLKSKVKQSEAKLEPMSQLPAGLYPLTSKALQSLQSEAKLEPMSLQGWKHRSLVAKEELKVRIPHKVGARYYVVVRIQGPDFQCTVPFYKSSGEGGKDNEVNYYWQLQANWFSKPVPTKGHWYPFYGISPKTTYINKGSKKDMLNMLHPLLKAVADALNLEFGMKASDEEETEKKLQQLHRRPPGEVEHPLEKSAIEYMNRKIGDGIVGAEDPWRHQFQECLFNGGDLDSVCINAFSNECRMSFNMLHILKKLDLAYQKRTLYEVSSSSERPIGSPLGKSLLRSAESAFPQANKNQIKEAIDNCELLLKNGF